MTDLFGEKRKNMTEKMYEELKEALLKAGMEAIDGFLGIPARTTDIEELKQLIEEEFDEMPEEDVKEYYYDVYVLKSEHS